MLWNTTHHPGRQGNPMEMSWCDFMLEARLEHHQAINHRCDHFESGVFVICVARGCCRDVAYIATTVIRGFLLFLFLLCS